MAATILDGKRTAALWRHELAVRVDGLRAQGVTPGLCIVRVGDDPASKVYVTTKERACRAVGLEARTEHLPAGVAEERVITTLEELAADPEVHGVIVQLPLPDGIDQGRVQEALPVAKDVDGLHPLSQGLVVMGRPGFVPATPRGIVELLRRYDIDLCGMRTVVIGRSQIVGRPLANLLSSRGLDATVTVCHSRTRNLARITREADLVVAAMGRPRWLGADFIRPGAVVVDVGINRVDDNGAKRGYRLVGDVDFEAVEGVAGALTPVPGGVGPMTVAALVHNTVVAAEHRAPAQAAAGA